MLKKGLTKSILILTLVYSSHVFAGIASPPRYICYQNCENAGYSHRQCLKACYGEPSSPRPRSSDDLSDYQNFLEDLDAVMRTEVEAQTPQ